MADVLHHDDGKQKHQSHEIYSEDLNNHFEIFLYGYGDSKAEAYQDFLKKLDEYIVKLNDFRTAIHFSDTVKVDCFGNPIKN